MTLAEIAMLFAWAGAACGPVVALLAWRRLGSAGRRTAGARVLLGFFALAYGLGVWAFLIEPRTLAVRHVSVESEAWRGPPLRIGVVSDTHVDAPHVTPERVRRLMARMAGERPDVVVFVGDYVGGHAPAAARDDVARTGIAEGIAAFGTIHAPLGRYAVLGNHDWWYGGREVEALLWRAGVPVLENYAQRVERPGGAFWIAGLADYASLRAQPSAAAALAAVSAHEPVVVLSHWPDAFKQVPARAALTIAAHSHCGQVNLPLLGRPITPSPGSARWPCGLYEEDGRKLLVTGGVGVSILPVRFRAPPEIVIVTLSEHP
ncbi:MAG: metallophosphoesterase [Pseudomonadota bacterium]|jgi:predicted MPP superfamily phosphohydrolase